MRWHVYISWQYGSNGETIIQINREPNLPMSSAHPPASTAAADPWILSLGIRNIWILSLGIQTIRHLDDPLARAYHLYLAKPPRPSWSRSIRIRWSAASCASESFRILIRILIRILTDGFETVKQEHGSTSTWQWELGIDTSCHQSLRAQCSRSPHRCRPPPLLNTDKELCRIRPRTMQADATKSACSIPATSSAQHPFIFSSFSTFRLF